jgi:phosphate transport system substrate-binding protein
MSAIGYVGLGHAKNDQELKVISISSGKTDEYIDPTMITADEAKKYAIIRTLNQYTDGKPSGAIRKFIEFELSPEGQQICEDMGFLPVSEEYKVYNTEALSGGTIE